MNYSGPTVFLLGKIVVARRSHSVLIMATRPCSKMEKYFLFNHLAVATVSAGTGVSQFSQSKSFPVAAPSYASEIAWNTGLFAG